MPEFKRVLVFLILMEAGEGIKTKSPAYMGEKWFSAMVEPRPELLLDVVNRAKYNRYLKYWSGWVDITLKESF